MKKSEFESEKEIILKAKKDVAAFDKLYERYYPLINSFVFHRVDNEDIRNDIVSSTFIKAIKKIYLFRFFDSRKTRFSSWLIKIAMNEINAHYNSEKRNRNTMEKQELHKNIYSDSEEMFPISFGKVKRNLKSLNLTEQNMIKI